VQVKDGEELSVGAIFGSAKVTQEADNVILIQDQRLTKVNGKKYIQVPPPTSSCLVVVVLEVMKIRSMLVL